MIILLSVETDRHLTGGYTYNSHVIRELTRAASVSYIYESADTILKCARIMEKIKNAEVLLVDSIFFSMPDTLKQIFNQAGLTGPGPPEKVLLLHWLPWLEEEKLTREFNGNAGDVPDLPPSPAGGKSKELLSLFSRFICTSEFSKRALTATGIAADLVCAAAPGVAERQSRRSRQAGRTRGVQPVIFSTLAHWTPVKGLHRLPPLLKELRQYDWRWLACGSVNGETSYGREVLSAIREAGIDERVDLLGPLPHKQAAKVLKKSTCLLVPSLFETYGMAAAESAALGTPVIGFETGGLPEAVRHGKDGFLCSSLSQFGETVKAVLENPNILPRPAADPISGPKRSWQQTAETIRIFLRRRG